VSREAAAGALGDLDIRGENLERLKTAVAEATMNAMEHGNKYRAEVPVEVVVLVEDRDLRVRITDRGSGPPPTQGGDAPDLEAKLEGMQTPRGWGLFLIKSMVDEMSISGDDGHHTIELVVHLGAEGGK
jgi:serine/threonine-protein kinase RsbW